MFSCMRWWSNTHVSGAAETAKEVPAIIDGLKQRREALYKKIDLELQTSDKLKDEATAFHRAGKTHAAHLKVTEYMASQKKLDLYVKGSQQALAFQTQCEQMLEAMGGSEFLAATAQNLKKITGYTSVDQAVQVLEKAARTLEKTTELYELVNDEKDQVTISIEEQECDIDELLEGWSTAEKSKEVADAAAAAGTPSSKHEVTDSIESPVPISGALSTESPFQQQQQQANVALSMNTAPQRWPQLDAAPSAPSTSLAHDAPMGGYDSADTDSSVEDRYNRVPNRDALVRTVHDALSLTGSDYNNDSSNDEDPTDSEIALLAQALEHPERRELEPA